MDHRPPSLLAWQRATYDAAHHSRVNLVVHLVTVPVFMLGTLLVGASPILGLRAALVGLTLAMGAMAVQGRTHRREATRPAPFRGPRDVVARIFAEQWITFPRFVLDGGLRRAWHETATART